VAVARRRRPVLPSRVGGSPGPVGAGADAEPSRLVMTTQPLIDSPCPTPVPQSRLTREEVGSRRSTELVQSLNPLFNSWKRLMPDEHQGSITRWIAGVKGETARRPSRCASATSSAWWTWLGAAAGVDRIPFWLVTVSDGLDISLKQWPVATRH
jgi:hypothetical protein